ncbi:MAG: L,D-transpeptidase scaffold domain-containing protein, partial [Bacteroidia bacterium]
MKKIQDVNASVSEALHSIFSKQLNDTMLLLLNDTIRTLSYFKSRYDHNALLWTSKGKYTALGDSLFKLVREARFYGLIPEDYHLTRLIRLKEKAFDKKDSLYDAFALAETEV